MSVSLTIMISLNKQAPVASVPSFTDNNLPVVGLQRKIYFILFYQQDDIVFSVRLCGGRHSGIDVTNMLYS